MGLFDHWNEDFRSAEQITKDERDRTQTSNRGRNYLLQCQKNAKEEANNLYRKFYNVTNTNVPIGWTNDGAKSMYEKLSYNANFIESLIRYYPED